VIRAPRAVLALLLGVTFCAATALLRFDPPGIRLAIDPSTEPLIPVNDPAYEAYRRAVTDFGDDQVYLIAMEAEDVFTAEHLLALRRVSDRVSRLDGIRGVKSLAKVTSFGYVRESDSIEVRPLIDDVPLDLDALGALRARATHDPLYRGTLVSQDGRAAALNVRFRRMSDREFIAKDLDGRIRRIVDEESGAGRRRSRHPRGDDRTGAGRGAHHRRGLCGVADQRRTGGGRDRGVLGAGRRFGDPGLARRDSRDPALLQSIEATLSRIDAIPAVSRTLSLLDPLRVLNRVVSADDPEQERVPDTRAAVTELLFMLPKADLQRFATIDHSSANLVVRTGAVGSAALRDLTAELELALDSLPPDLFATITGNPRTTWCAIARCAPPGSRPRRRCASAIATWGARSRSAR